MSIPLMNKRSMVVLVDDWASAPDAIRAAEELLDMRRRDGGAGRPGDELLGVWCRPGAAGPQPATLRNEPDPAAGLSIRASLALCGQWSLCWLDGPLFDGVACSNDRRTRLLDFLVEGMGSASASFAPVYEEHEAESSVRASLHAMQHRHPAFVRDTIYVDHHDDGLRVGEVG
ncbi:MAG: hypothetical protein AAGD14_06300 [Planctomycetota bacterium]